MKVCLKMEMLMGSESSISKMDQNIEESGFKTKNKAKVSNSGEMDNAILGNGNRVKKMAMDNYIFRMEAITKAHFLTMNLMELENIVGIANAFIKEDGNTIK